MPVGEATRVGVLLADPPPWGLVRPAGREEIGVGPGPAAAARHYTLGDENLQNSDMSQGGGAGRRHRDQAPP